MSCTVKPAPASLRYARPCSSASKPPGLRVTWSYTSAVAPYTATILLPLRLSSCAISGVISVPLVFSEYVLALAVTCSKSSAKSSRSSGSPPEMAHSRVPRARAWSTTARHSSVVSSRARSASVSASHSQQWRQALLQR